jgi:acyl-CoA hydrolase
MTAEVQAALRRWIRPGCTIAIADGVGSPTGLYRDLSAVAADVPELRLILGWCPQPPEDLDLARFSEVRAFMPGPALSGWVKEGTVKYVPAYVSQLPALFAGDWRPDVLLLAVCGTQQGLNLGTEGSWMKVAARAAGVTLAELNTALPNAARGMLLDGVDLTVVAETHRPPLVVSSRPPDDRTMRIGTEVARLVPPGAVIQFGPGPIALAVVSALTDPVGVDSGIITDAVVDLDARGLLTDAPLGTYLAGSEKLYEWANHRALLDGIDVTHDPTRLSSRSLVAINTALQIDLLGQVALEGTTRVPATGIGGHTDYAYAASRSPTGLSIIAVPTERGGRSTLVERLELPVSTPRSVVDVVVTEYGHVDLRGRTDTERAAAIASVFR